MIEEKYQQWLNHPGMDEDLKAELAAMDEKQKKDAFYTNAEFGTAGMRGLLGAGTNRLNTFTIRKATFGLAEYLVKQGGEISVAIAYDNRFKSPEFARESAKVLASYGIKTYVYESLRTTPQCSYTVRHLNCTAGIMITASHNPKEYNGYKVYDSTGCQMVPTLVAGVIEEINKLGDQLMDSPVLTSEQEKLIVTIGEEIDKVYLNEVLKIQLNPDVPKDNFKIVYTPQHGTSYKSLRYLFDTVGYDVVYVEEQCTPDPAFSNTIIPNPEDPRAYNLAIEYANKYNADIVMTTDPDGDRLGVAVKDETGEWKVQTGNQTGAVLLEYVFSQMKEKGLMPAHPVMFNTVVTSDLGEKIARYYGVDVDKTLTGFKYIGNLIHGYEISHEKDFVFGYEESYGYLLSTIVRDKDANQSCLMIAEAANYYHKQGKSFWDVLYELYDRFGTYAETQQSITLPGADGAEKLKKLLADLRANVPAELAGHKVVKYQDFGTQKCVENGVVTDIVGYDKSDVLKYFMDDESWIAVRPSGTEPKCKFYYCIKGSSKDDVAKKQAEYYEAIKKLTNQ